jgi:LmbE family N-acetylglucosaminyl deacetylase
MLIVVAHPDDDCGFGALVYMMSHNKNATVDLCVVTDGAGGYRYSAVAEFLYGLDLTNETVARKHLAAIRQKEEREGASFLGIDRVTFLGQYDAFTTNATEALSWWDVATVKTRLKGLLDERRYDYILTMLPGEGENHGEHKAATILALEVASEHKTAPIVLGGPGLVHYAPLPEYPITRAPAAPSLELNRTAKFGFRDALDYRMVVAWAKGAHKSQGGEEMDLATTAVGDREVYWVYDANPPGAAKQAAALFDRVAHTPFRYYNVTRRRAAGAAHHAN